MIPKGLAAAVLAEYPVHLIHTIETLSEAEKLNLVPVFENLRTIVYSVVLFSIVLSAILIMFEENNSLNKIYKKILPFDGRES